MTKREAIHDASDYATSSNVGKYRSLARWSSLGAMLSNNTARAIYALPIAGYVILYSDYFQSLFKFSVLSSPWELLSFTARINMIYYGSLILLLAYGLFWHWSPPLLRRKRDLQHFATDMIVARDSPTILHIASAVRQYIEPLPLTNLEVAERERLQTLLDNLNARSTKIGQGAGEYEDIIPRILSFYYNWQNVTRPTVRGVIFCLTIVGYSLLLLPSFDLFLRVLGTNLRNWFGYV